VAARRADFTVFIGFANLRTTWPVVPTTELMDGREHHAADGPVQQLAQIFPPAGLHRRLTEDVRAALELPPDCDALSVDGLSTVKM
jgi:hypothetical protein